MMQDMLLVLGSALVVLFSIIGINFIPRVTVSKCGKILKIGLYTLIVVCFVIGMYTLRTYITPGTILKK